MREPFGRLDADPDLHDRFAEYCRLGPGDIWTDPQRGHRVGRLDATSEEDLSRIASGQTIRVAVNDPPYNMKVGAVASDVFGNTPLAAYLEFSKRWIDATISVLADDAHLFIFAGADVRRGFQPLADLIILLRGTREVTPRSLITVRNQRGYGTQKNWMWVRQELLHYAKGNPEYTVVYTEIPKILRGYYKQVGGSRRENLERSRARTIRPGNVWVDIQQVFYRMKENVPGAYAQKPLAAIERILSASSREGETVIDCFSHSGTTLIAGERLRRRVLALDIDPVYAELTIRRLEHFRRTGEPGFQCANPFPEVAL